MRTLLVSIILIISWATLQAQTDNFNEEWRFAHFTTSSGLPSDQVGSICETADGTVWAATTTGLAWYDGFHWNTIDTGKGLPLNSFVSISGIVGDSLLVGCFGKYYLGTMQGFRITDIQKVLSAVPLTDHSVLFLRGASLYRYENNSIQPFQPSLPLTEGKTTSLVRTSGGGVWANFISGVYRLDNNTWQCKLRAISHPYGKVTIVENSHETGVAVIQFPFEQRGLWEWTRSSIPTRNPNEHPDDIKAMDISSNDEVIIVYQSDDIRIRRNGVWVSLKLGKIGIRDILSVKYRANGDLWIGTEHGLYLYKRSSSRWTNWVHESPDLRNSINEILKTRDGSIWLGTSNGIEIHRPDGATQAITSINGTTLYIVTGLAEDTEGNIWISSGASFSGAFKWDGRQWTHFEVSNDTAGILFHKIRTDTRGRVWFLGIGKYFQPVMENQPGAYVLENNHFVHWGKEEGLINGRVYSFAEGNDGALWFGTFGGLSRWKQGRWTHWTRDMDLQIGRIFTLTIDQKNKVWFGDYGDRNGVGYIDEHDSVHYYTTADGLLNDKVWDVRVDVFGKLWISTQGGLSCYDNGVWSTFDEKSGLSHLILWPVLPSEQYVYVGTTGRGVAILHRDESNTPDPAIRLEKPLAEGQNVLLRWKTFAFWGELAPSEILTRIRVNNGSWSPWEKKAEATLHELDPGEYVYQVQAKGLFGNFNVNGSQGSFTVPLPLHLRPLFLLPMGALALSVIALGFILFMLKRKHNLDLKKSEEKFRTVTEMTSSAMFIYDNAKLLFVNSGAEALTGYVKADLLTKEIFDIIDPSDREMMRERELGRSGITSVPHRYEIKLVTKAGVVRWVDFTSGWITFQGMPLRLGTAFDITDRKQAEEKLRLLASELSLTEERERRRMAVYLHDVIGQTLAMCKIKIRSLQRSPSVADAEKSLNEARELVEQSIRDTQSLTFELCPPILYELRFEAAVEWLAEQMQLQHSISFRVEDDKERKPLANDFRVILFQAVREIFINVVKHAEAKNVNVVITKFQQNIRIEITDDGIGIDTSKQTHREKSGGFGLFNIRERLMYLGGKLEITSLPARGTHVTITAPLHEDPHVAA